MAENEDQVNEPEQTPAEETPAEETPAEETPAAEAEETPAAEAGEAPVAEAEEVVVEGDEVLTEEELEDEYIEEKPREKPAIPGMDLEVDIVREGDEAFRD